MILLEKAAICSKFIAENLAEVMSPDEKRIPEMAENKRKSGRKNSVVNKRQKMGSTHLAQIIANDMEKREAKDEMMKFPQPPNLANGCELKDYQLEGLRWLSALYQNGVSGILADDMGLGKTMQSIAMIAYLLDKKVRGPFLVVAPLATLPNWIREFQKWLPGHPVVRYHGLAQEREKLLKGPLHYKNRLNEEFPCIITSYECLMKDRVQLDKLSPFEYVIVDEGHRLKNHRCALTVCLKRFKINNRLLLTGTPIQNDLDELWSLLNFVNPAIFDDLPKFKSWFKFQKIGQNVAGATSEQDVLTQEENNRVVTILHEIIRPFLLRRTKVDVLSELPPKKEVVVYSGISSLQLEYAQLIENGTLREELMNLGIEVGRHISQTNKTMNHRKNTNHPFLFGEPLDPDSGMPVGTAHPQLLLRASGKFALLDRMLVRLHNDGRKVLVFSQMTRMLDIIEDYLIFRQWNYCRIDGSTDIDDRQKEMDVFNAEMLNGAKKTRNMAKDRHFVFLLSTRAGGVGINLTAADTCIIFDSDWNPHTDCQAMDRYVFINIVCR
jgi:ATP-dependent DNA helicase